MSEYPSVTIAKMTKLDTDKAFGLPKEFIDAIKPSETDQAVIILAPNTRTIRIIPTVSQEVVKFNINIEKLSPDFLRRMGTIFSDFGVNTLYSTGLCFTQNVCVYEGYIDTKELQDVSIDTIKNEIESIDGVASVDTEGINL